MKSVILLLVTGFWSYSIEIVLVGVFLAFITNKRKKALSWVSAIPLLMIFFALNEACYLPVILNTDITFTIHNQEVAEFLEVGENESLSNFILTGFFGLLGWFIEAWLAFGVNLFLTRKSANHPTYRTENTSVQN